LTAYGCVDRHDLAQVVVGWPVVLALIWTVAVEMPFAGGQDRADVLFVVNEDMVDASGVRCGVSQVELLIRDLPDLSA
jgi:hypothetical protein